jgi:folate-binding protein YgfZ
VTVPTTTLAGEYAAATEGCALVDRSERGKLALSGREAIEFLNGQVTNELMGLQPGEGRYAAFLTHKGKMLGDLRILATEDELLLDTERAALQALFDMIRRFKVGYAVELHKRTLERTLVSLIGPGSVDVVCGALSLRASAPPDVEDSHVAAGLDGLDLRVIATDAGLDLLFESSALQSVQAALLAAGAVQVDEQTAEVVRVERGRPRYGIDLDDGTIPQEAGLNERAVSFTKGCYVGQETVARLFYKGKPNRHLRGLRFSEPVPAGTELLLGARPVGVATSTVVSPRLGPIGLGLLRREAEPGMSVASADGRTQAIVSELPLV